MRRLAAILVAVGMFGGAFVVALPGVHAPIVTLTLADYPRPFVDTGRVSGTLVVGLGQPHFGRGASNTIDVVGGVAIAGAFGALTRTSTSGLSSLLDIEAVNAAGTAATAPGNLFAIAGKGVNQITFLYNASMPLRVEAGAKFGLTGPVLWNTENNNKYQKSVCDYFQGCAVTDYGYFTLAYDGANGRYVFIAAGFSGFATRAVTRLIALATPALLQGTGVVVRFNDTNGDAVYETYQVVDGTGGITPMASPAAFPSPGTVGKSFVMGLAQPHFGRLASNTIDVVGAIPLAVAQARNLTTGRLWSYLDIEAVTSTGSAITLGGDVISLGGRNVNQVSFLINSSLTIRFDPGAKWGYVGLVMHNYANNNTWQKVNDYFLGVPVQDYALDSTVATGGRTIEVVAGFSGFATRAASVSLANGTASRGVASGIVLSLYDANGDGVYEKIFVADSTSAVTYQYYDFFNVPYGEYWDWRTGVYGDLPMNAECFNATSITDGICTPTNAAVPDTPSYPYTDWYPAPCSGLGCLKPGDPNNNANIYAPYRFKAFGREQTGYNTSEPVFLPVLNYAQPPGNKINFDISFNYLDVAGFNHLAGLGCPINYFQDDGFVGELQMTVTMDLQSSKRLFGVVATDATSARTWWNTWTKPECYLEGAVEQRVENWTVLLGGPQSASAKYDIANGYEYFYSPFYTQVLATVDADGTTHVTLDQGGWGAEGLLARMFYWGNASYQKYFLDSSKARGWWGMELDWFENLHYWGDLGPVFLNFNLTSVMQYSFQEWTKPGPDGYLNRVGDVPYWYWGPVLDDYTMNWGGTCGTKPCHPASEMLRYYKPVQASNLTYLHTTPGSPEYNKSILYDYTPVTWNLKPGDRWTITLPTTSVAFHDPNTTPLGANPTKGQYVQFLSVPAFDGTYPLTFGTWTPTTGTFLVRGPLITGGPPGTPTGGYALWPTPMVMFRPT